MWKSHLVVAVRVLLRSKLITAINIVGLSAALAICVLAMLYVRYEWTYDAFHAKADRIHAVVTESKGAGPGSGRAMMLSAEVVEALRRDYPGIARATRVLTGYPKALLGGEWAEEWIVGVDPEFAEIFTFPLAEGQADRAFSDPAGVVLTREAAARYCPGRAALGEHITFRFETRDYSTYPPKDVVVEEQRVVAGVLEPIPPNSSLQFTMLVPAESAAGRRLNSVSGVFIELRPGVDAGELGRQLAPLADVGLRVIGPGGGQKRSLELVSLPDVHFSELIMGPVYRQAERSHTYVLAGIGVLVLVIACINFVNLAVGRGLGRTREIGVRKAIGAASQQVATQFLVEAFVVAAIAVVGGLALAEELLPSFNAMAGRSLSLPLVSIDTAIGALLLTAVVGLLAGLYPAIGASRFQPVRALGSRSAPRGGHRLGRSLIVVQFAASVFLIIATLVMGRQVEYMKIRDLGYDGDQVALVSGLGIMVDELVLARFQGELAQGQTPHVLSVAGAAPAPGLGMPLGQMTAGDVSIATGGFYVSPEFVRTLGIRLVSGRDFAPQRASDWSSAVLLNESAARRLSALGPGVGVQIPGVGAGEQELTVIGVVEDFHYDTMQHRIGPVYIRLQQSATLFGRTGLYYWHLLARLDRSDLAAGIGELRELWGRASLQEGAPHLQFLDESMDERYATEERWARVMAWAGGFAIGIACMGLFGLAAQAAVRRTKEIGIRKALGATVGSVLALQSKEFAVLVMVASLVAWPVAYLAAARWLDGFAYRTDLGIGMFVAAALLALAAAWITVSCHAVRAARANPVEALRYE